MKKLVTFILMTLAINANAGVWWLNIPGHYDPISGRHIPDTSFVTSSQDACSNAVVEYAKDELVHWIGCSVKPLPGAVNVSDRVKMKYRGK